MVLSQQNVHWKNTLSPQTSRVRKEYSLSSDQPSKKRSKGQKVIDFVSFLLTIVHFLDTEECNGGNKLTQYQLHA